MDVKHIFNGVSSDGPETFSVKGGPGASPDEADDESGKGIACSTMTRVVD